MSLVTLALAAWMAAAPATPGQTLLEHPLRLDAAGRIEPWLPADRAFDGVMRRAWGFLTTSVPKDANGLPLYLTHSCIEGKTLKPTAWPHNPAGLYAMMAESAIGWHAYAGDRSVIPLVAAMLDHQLAHGTTPKTWAWGGVPYASSDHGSVTYRGAHDFRYDLERPARGDGYGAIEPDKIGELGLGYLRFWMLTGKASYRDAAISCANALAKHGRAGDATHSPWPFRVYAEGNVVREEYSASLQGPLRLFDELVRLRLGDVPSYQRARKLAFDWLLAYPMKNERWANYFEDISFRADIKNVANINPIEIARYLIDRSATEPSLRELVPPLLAYVERTFGNDAQNEKGTVKEPGVQWGAITISEQLAYRFKMGSHTSRFASVLARWHEVSGDATAKDKAYRSFAWATYMCQEDGRVITGPNERSIWFTDGYGDYVRHYMAGLGAVPVWAPPKEDHLLRSSSVVTKVAYAPGRVEYRTFDDAGTEVLRLSFAPKVVRAGGRPLPALSAWSSEAGGGYAVEALDGGDVVVRVRRGRARDVVVALR